MLDTAVLKVSAIKHTPSIKTLSALYNRIFVL